MKTFHAVISVFCLLAAIFSAVVLGMALSQGRTGDAIADGFITSFDLGFAGVNLMLSRLRS